MLLIKVELHPAGGGEIETLATLQIVNDGTGTLGTGNYDVEANEVEGLAVRRRKGRVEGYPRSAGLGVLELVWRAINAITPG